MGSGPTSDADPPADVLDAVAGRALRVALASHAHAFAWHGIPVIPDERVPAGELWIYADARDRLRGREPDAKVYGFAADGGAAAEPAHDVAEGT
jgi:hypothetical protein